MKPCPVSYHAHDCDCRRAPSGKWIIDPACAAKHKRIASTCGSSAARPVSRA
jgi:hypothetical protein